MSRTITGTALAALQNPHGYKLLARMDVYPSRVFFDTITRDNPITGADIIPAGDNPMRQDIVHSTAGLVTFYGDGSLKYAVDGNATPVTTTTSTTQKPGVIGSTIFVIEGANCKRYSINWTQISNLETAPLSLQATLTPTDTPVTVHALSATECVTINDGDGGFSVSYFNGTTEVLSDVRFMFPSAVDWAGSARTYSEMASFSSALKLGNRIFTYMTSAQSGMVMGLFYDLDTATWSDVFTAMPTDLDVSLCEFRISNGFTRNNQGYLVGQIIRTDIFETNTPFSLILSTTDGLTFSIDRFTLVSDLGYRFLGTVGSNNELYIANCNRVCQAPSTWVFDGDDDSTSPVTAIEMADIIHVNDSNLDSMDFSLRAGDETIFDNPHFIEGSRVRLYMGYETSVGDEYFLYGTYIIDSAGKDFANGERNYSARCIVESKWKGTGLSMPFYAEILGLSTIYDPMTEAGGKLYAASSGVRTTTFFSLDFWDSEAYTNATQSITGVTLGNGGGVDVSYATGNHKQGVMVDDELKNILLLTENPKITATTVNARVYGWSKPTSYGAENDLINLIILTTDDEDGDEQYAFTTQTTSKWTISYPWTRAGDDPVQIAITGMEIGRRIKKIGVIVQCATSTEYIVARVDVIDGVESSVSLALANTPWEAKGDGTFTVPAGGQPFIMFAQRPYNAWNFHLMSLFSNTVTGGITGYATATGLVGLAIDAANYILARYDKTSSKVQLVKVVSGIEYLLAEATPGWSLGDTHGFQFAHKDGTFKVSMLNESTSRYEIVLTYNWTASNGYMYTNPLMTRKCGIYGAILSPFVKIMAFASNAQDSISNVDGIAMDPAFSHSAFPSSGRLRVGKNVYSYASKITPATLIEGPYQLRNTSSSYAAPFGNGMAGLENRYFNWYAPTNKWAGKFIAIDTGSVFKIAESFFRVYITTGGVVQWLRNRSRHYSSNTMIGKISATTAAKCWMGLGGFQTVSLLSGTSARESNGSYAMLELSGAIKCYWFMGAGGEADTTVRDLILKIAKYAGTSSTFPGDIYQSSLTVNGEVAIGQDDYAEGYDIEFEIDAPQDFEIRSNVKMDGTNYEEAALVVNDTGTKLVFEHVSDVNFRLSLVSTPSDTVLYTINYISGTALQRFRVLYHENNISVYHNHRWVVSLTFDSLIYTQTSYVDVKAYSASSITFNEIWMRDLQDWREAVYIDLETDAMSAIGSVIQERPIEIHTNPDGSLRCFYEMTRPSTTLATVPYSHKISTSIPRDGASDAIVYGSNDVKTIISSLFAKAFGFATKLFRLPNLNVGATEAAYRMLKKSYESRINHNLDIRPDIRFLTGERLVVSYTLSATEKVISEEMIVESFSISLRAGSESSFSVSERISARGYVDG